MIIIVVFKSDNFGHRVATDVDNGIIAGLSV